MSFRSEQSLDVVEESFEEVAVLEGWQECRERCADYRPTGFYYSPGDVIDYQVVGSCESDFIPIADWVSWTEMNSPELIEDTRAHVVHLVQVVDSDTRSSHTTVEWLIMRTWVTEKNLQESQGED